MMTTLIPLGQAKYGRIEASRVRDEGGEGGQLESKCVTLSTEDRSLEFMYSKRVECSFRFLEFLRAVGSPRLHHIKLL